MTRTPDRFLDSNVLLYVASADPRKAAIAEALLEEGGTIGVQVLNEVANVARRKMGLSWPEVTEFLANLRGLLRVEPLTVATHERGLALAARYGLSLYDAMIAAAALEAGNSVLLSEDMQDGMALGGLTVRNPFQAAAT
jgi:predicted nucleic acid-binding protein